MKTLTALLVSVVLVGCAGSYQTRSTAALAIACSTYATMLDTLTPMRRAGKLSDSIVRRVDSANQALKPICAKGSTIDPAEGVATVESAIILIKSIKEQF